MNTLNKDYVYRSRPRRITYARTAGIIHKILLVFSVYLIFGLLFQYAYADIDMNNTTPRPLAKLIVLQHHIE